MTTTGILIFIMLVALKLSRKPKIIDIRHELTRSNNWASRDLKGVTDITLHHFAGNKGDSIESAAAYHSRKWGFAIAYHIVIKEGRIYQCLDLKDRSYHNGFNNTKAVAISVVGNYSNYELSKKDKKAILDAARFLQKEIPSIHRFVGHSEYKNSTECCGNLVDVDYFRNKLNLEPYPKSLALVNNGVASFSASDLQFNNRPAYDRIGDH